jgi:hypothetical protein
LGSELRRQWPFKGLNRTTTPWAGTFERINAYSYFAWLVVLAVIVHRSLDQNDVALRSCHERSERIDKRRQEHLPNGTTETS